MRAKWEQAVTWWNPAAQTCPVLNPSSFTPAPVLPCRTCLHSASSILSVHISCHIITAFVFRKPRVCIYIYIYIHSGPSSYDRLDIRTTWVTTKNFSFGLRPKSWVMTRMSVKATWVMTRMAFVSISLSPDTRVCGRNSGQCIALYNYFR
jgi:hypothetical protein